MEASRGSATFVAGHGGCLMAIVRPAPPCSMRGSEFCHEEGVSMPNKTAFVTGGKGLWSNFVEHRPNLAGT